MRLLVPVCIGWLSCVVRCVLYRLRSESSDEAERAKEIVTKMGNELSTSRCTNCPLLLQRFVMSTNAITALSKP